VKTRIWDIIFGLVFIYAVIVQYNDPDPLRWMLIYGGAAVACLIPRIRWYLPAIVAVVALVWMITTLPAIFEARDFTGTEIEREAGGLLIVSIWMLDLVRRKRRS